MASSLIKLRLERKGTVIWQSVGMFGGSMSSDCFGGFLDQITTGKKGTVIWPSVAMFGGFQLSGHWLEINTESECNSNLQIRMALSIE